MEIFKGYLPLINEDEKLSLNPKKAIDESNQNSEKNYEYVDENLKALSYLGELKRINIFVGANNSGKNHLRRAFYFSTKNLGDILLAAL